MSVTPFEMTGRVVGIKRDGTSEVIESHGPPVRLDGHTFGVARIDRNPPHNGEMHPDGDELLYLVSGSLDLVVEEGGTHDEVGEITRTRFSAGQGVLIPRGVWHKVEVLEPTELIHLTPGPGDGHRLLGR